MKTRLVLTRFSHICLTVWLAFGVVLGPLAPLGQLVAQAQPLASTTIPGGTLTTNTEWTVAGSPYLVQGAVYIGSGVTLTIDPGVTVKFATGGGYGLYLSQTASTLVAEGTAAAPITFTGAAPGNWLGFTANGDHAHLRLSHCDISYTGYGSNYAIYVDYGATLSLTDCAIHNGVGVGLYVGANGVTGTVQNVRIERQQLPTGSWAAIYQASFGSTLTYRNVTLANNGVDALLFDSASVATGQQFSLDSSPAALNGAPIILNRGLSLASGARVTVAAGSTLKFAASTSLNIGGANTAFDAEGTPTRPITLTSLAATPASGDWQGITINGDQATLRLGYCDLGYTGYGGVPAINVSYGVANVAVSDCAIHEGQGGVAYVTGSAWTQFHNNRFSAMGSGIATDSGTQYAVDARKNWWGSLTGPYHPALNLTGRGLTITDQVMFAPWLGAYNLLLPDRSLVNGTEALAWNDLGTSQGVTVAVSVQGTASNILPSGAVTLGYGLPPSDSLIWDTTGLPDGAYQVQATYFQNGVQVGAAARSYTVHNGTSVCAHRDDITSDETWTADCVHVVLENLDVSSGATLTVAPGAVVKFEKDRRLNLSAGSTLNGGSQAIFTSLADDTAGDTNLDGDQSRPQPGDWDSFSGVGALNLAADAAVRYARYVRFGALGANEVWRQNNLYWLRGIVEIPAHGALTIEPGVMVKFDKSAELWGRTGAALVAQGTAALPIVFTSLKDDSVGGDTDGDGGLGRPTYADWDCLRLDSGRGDFDYVQMRYAGRVCGTELAGSDLSWLSVNHALIRDSGGDGITASGATLFISNTVVAHTDHGLTVGGTHTTIVNTTVDQTTYSGVHLEGGTAYVRNTNVTNYHTYGIEQGYGAAVGELDYNNFWSSIATSAALNVPGSSLGAHDNLSVDPLYRDAAGGDYRLSYTSPLIDAADTPGAPPDDRLGTPRCNSAAPTHLGVPSNGLYADIGAYEVCADAPSNVDLVAGNVSGPAAIMAGDLVTVGWDVRNIGSETVLGGWHDHVWLVGGDTLDVAEVPDTPAELGPGQTVHKIVQVRVPGGTLGVYHWQVTTNSRAEVFEGRNIANNIAVSAAAAQLDLPELPVDGAAVTRLASTAGEPLWFKFNPPSGRDVTVSVSRPDTAGVTEAYLARETLATRYNSEVRENPFAGANVSLYAANTLSDTYYVTVIPTTLPNGPALFSLQAAAVDFSLRAVTPGMAGQGQVTLHLDGARLSADDTYQLIAPGRSSVEATFVTLPDPGSAFAQFDLTSAAAGVYTVCVTNPAHQIRQLASALRVTTTVPASILAVSLAMPNDVRANREAQGLVIYENTGNTDVVAPLITIDTSDGVGLRLADDGDYQPGSLDLIGAAPDGPPNVLRPGQRGQAVLYFNATDDSSDVITWTQSVLLATSSDAIDFAALEPLMRSPQITDTAQWSAMWSLFQTAVGPTWGGYVGWLASYTPQVQASGGRPQSMAAALTTGLGDLYRQVTTNVRGTLWRADTQQPLTQGTLVLTSDTDSATTQSTAPQGQFRLWAPAGLVTVTVPGFQVTSPQQINVPASGSLDGVAITVTRGAPLAGTVRTQNGQPISGTLISVENDTGVISTAQANAYGAYEVLGLPGGAYTVTTLAPGWVNAATAVVLADGQRADGLDFTLSQAAGATGSVVDAGGHPISDTLVTFWDADDNAFSAVTDSAGTYTLGDLPGNVWKVTASADGYGTGKQRNVMLTGGVTTALPAFTLTDEAVVSATVRDANTHSPLNLVGLILEDQDGDLMDMEASDTNGQARLGGLAAGVYTLTTDMYDYLPLTQVVTVATGQGLAQNLDLLLAGIVTGYVRTNTAAPVAGAMVRYVSADGASMLEAPTDANGYYELHNLPYGPAAMALDWSQQRQPVTLTQLARTADIAFTYTGTALAGRVVLADGATPVGNAEVLLLRGGVPVASARSDAAGYYQFSLLANGAYSVTAASDEGLSWPQALNATGAITAPDLVMGSAPVTVTVKDAGGRPVQSAYVLARPMGALSADDGWGFYMPYLSDQTDSRGQMMLRGVAPGAYELRVGSTDAGAYRGTFVVVTGATTVNVTLSAGAVVYGQVSLPNGVPITDSAQILLYDQSDPARRYLRSSAVDGNYVLGNIPNGTYDAYAILGGFQAVSAPLAISGTQLVWSPQLVASNTVLTYTVTDAQGRRLIGARVVIRNARGQTLVDALTDYTGGVVTDWLTPGSYTAEVQQSGWSTASTAFTLAAGANTSQATLTPLALSQSTSTSIAGQSVFSLADAADEKVPTSLTGNIIYQVDQWLDRANNRPQRETLDWLNYEDSEMGGTVTSLPPSCPKCYEAARLWHEINSVLVPAKDELYHKWEHSYQDYKRKVSASTRAYWLQVGKVSLSAVSALGPGGKVKAAVAAVDTLLNLASSNPADLFSGKTIEAAAKSGNKLAAGIYALAKVSKMKDTLLNTFKTIAHQDWSDPTTASTQTGIALEQMKIKLSGDVMGTINVVRACAGSPEWKKFVGNSSADVLGLAKFVSDLYDFVKDTYKRWDQLDQALRKPNHDAQAYHTALRKVMAANKQFYKALQDCAKGCKAAPPCTKCNPKTGYYDPTINCPPPTPPKKKPCPGNVECRPSPGTGKSSSHDPNEKLTTQLGPNGQILLDTALLYTIRFENAPTATAPAQWVLVDDALSAQLDWSSVELQGIGFNNVTLTVPAGRSAWAATANVATDPNPVKITAALNPATGVLEWELESVDAFTGQTPENLLAGFLPPNSPAPSGEGWVSFRVKPRAGLALGTVINNKARIVFDANAPLDTNTTSNVIVSAIGSGPVAMKVYLPLVVKGGTAKMAIPADVPLETAMPIGTIAPTVTATATLTETVSPTATATPPFLSSPTVTPTGTVAPTETIAPAGTAALTATATPSVLPNQTITATLTTTATLTETPLVTGTPTETPFP